MLSTSLGTVVRPTAPPTRLTLASATPRTRLLPSLPWVSGVPTSWVIVMALLSGPRTTWSTRHRAAILKLAGRAFDAVAGWGGARFGAGLAGGPVADLQTRSAGGASAVAEQPRLVILGHSMGAGVGSLVAGSVPEGTVAGMVMVESVGFMSEEAEGLPVRLRRAIVDAAARAVTSSGASRAGPQRGGRVYKSLQEAAEARQANARA